MGCVSNEQPQYIGTIPTYANKAPHAESCPCCGSFFKNDVDITQ